MRKKVCVVTAIHNDLKNLNKLLISLDSQDFKNFSVIVVDDNSTDETHEFLKKNYSDLIYLKGNGKLWWTGSINKAIMFIISNKNIYDYILTINNDCQLDSKYLSNILRKAENKSIIGSKIIDINTLKMWDIGIILDWKNGMILPRLSNDDDLDALSTKGTLYPTEMFKKIGLLSKYLPHYLSDYEISVRAKRNGYKLSVCLDCIVKNNTENTGIGDKIMHEKGIKNIIKFGFSRRSKVNIIDQFWFITLACPKKYKIKNYIFLIIKSIKIIKKLLISSKISHNFQL